MKKTLLLIATFIVFVLGSFIWFIATWDPCACTPADLNVPTVYERAIT